MALDCDIMKEMGTAAFVQYVQDIYKNPITPIKEFYPETVDIGGVTWMAAPLTLDDNGIGIYSKEIVFGKKTYYYTVGAANRIVDSLSNGWRIPTINDFLAALKHCGATERWEYREPHNDIRKCWYQRVSRFVKRIGGYRPYCFIEDSIGNINHNYPQNMEFLTSSLDFDDKRPCIVRIESDTGFTCGGIPGDYRFSVPYHTADGVDAYPIILVK